MSTTGSTSTAPPVKKASWLSKVGAFIGKILGVIAKDAKPVAATAAQIVAIVAPQFSALATVGENLVDNIANEVIAVEGVAAATKAQTGTGAQKLETALQNIGPAINAWVAAKFPGATAISKDAKAGLVNSVVAILNEVDPAAVPPAAATPAS